MPMLCECEDPEDGASYFMMDGYGSFNCRNGMYRPN